MLPSVILPTGALQLHTSSINVARRVSSLASMGLIFRHLLLETLLNVEVHQKGSSLLK